MMRKLFVIMAVILALMSTSMSAVFAEPIMVVKTNFNGKSSLNGEDWAQRAINHFSYNFKDADKITAYASRVDNKYDFIMFVTKYSDHSEYYGLRDDNNSMLLTWKQFDNYQDMRNYCFRKD